MVEVAINIHISLSCRHYKHFIVPDSPDLVLYLQDISYCISTVHMCVYDFTFSPTVHQLTRLMCQNIRVQNRPQPFVVSLQFPLYMVLFSASLDRYIQYSSRQGNKIQVQDIRLRTNASCTVHPVFVSSLGEMSNSQILLTCDKVE